jgi:hypothetical protein
MARALSMLLQMELRAKLLLVHVEHQRHVDFVVQGAQ